MRSFSSRWLSVVGVVAGCWSVAIEAVAEVPRLRREVSDIRRADALAAVREGGLPEAAGRQAGPLGPIAEDATSRAGSATDGIAWLKADQNGTGSWGSAYEFVDTCTVIETLAEADPDCDELSDGAAWLAGQTAANNEFLARQISALAWVPGYEDLVSDLADELLEARNPAEPDPGLPNWPEGGWGIAEGYETDCLTTALAMKALDAVGLNGGFAVNDEPLAAGATNTHEWDIPEEAVKVRITITVAGSTVHLRMKEGSPPGPGDPYFPLAPGSWLIVFPDSGLPFTPGHNYITIASTGPAATYTMTASYETPTFDTRTLAEPLAYLREAQNVDGGWGLQRGQPTEFYTTLHVLLTLAEWLHYDFETEHADGITYLKSQQLGDGSFGYEGIPIAYVTALAALNLVRSESYPFSTETEDAIAALLAMQEVDGSWDQEPYDTALAVLALWDHNQDPTADAGPDQNVTDTDEDCLENVTLDGTGSADIDGTIESYVWTEDGVETATGPSPVVTLAVGTHTLQLTVTDDGGKTATDTVIIDVVGTGVPPDVCHCCFATGACQDLDPLECLGLGGTPGPGACTTAEACCLPDDTCQMLDPLCCIAEDGTSFVGEVCTSPAACCFPSGECVMLDAVCCVAEGGTAVPYWVCVDPVACCQSDGNCALLDPICCQLQGDAPQDEGSVCTSPEGCCLSEGECVDADPECCDDVGGVSQGADTTCTAPEACCLPYGTCEMLDPLCCVDQDGAPQGPESACTEPEPCCLPDGGCVELDPLCCTEMSGVASPDGALLCFGDANGNGLDDACEPSGLKWVQLPDLDSTGLDVQAQQPPGVLLADDFQCSQTGRITEIRIWGSWLGDTLPDGDAGNVTFTLSVHADIPEGPGGWSEPGDSLWTHTSNPGEFGYEVYDSGLDEGWYDSLSGTYEPSADAVCWLYTFPIPEGEGFAQEGTSEAPIIYWLDLQALPTGEEAYFGWKTSLYHWNDDAVWAEGDELAHGPWQELRYPDGHPMHPESIDLAFLLIAEPAGPPGHRPLAEDCSTIGSSPTCNDGTTACSVALQDCPPGLEPCAFQFPGTRCQNDPTVPCTTDDDCRDQSICVPPPTGQEDDPYPYDHYCYAPKTRYLSIKASPKQAPDTARRVKLDDGTLLGWVGEPYPDSSDVHSNPYIVAQVVAAPYYAQTWPDIVHVHTCEIAHASLCDLSGVHCKPNLCPGAPVEQCINHRYGIQAIVIGDDILDEGNYTEPLWLNTADTWGDTVGSCGGNICQPPNGLPALDDIMAAIAYFQGNTDVAPLVWIDIDPSNQAQCPEQVVGLGDIMSCIAGFQGATYPGDGPLGCP